MLVTGASGYLGRRVAGEAASLGWSVVGTYLGHPLSGDAGQRLDVRDAEAVRQVVQRLRPDVVVHTAAAPGDWTTIAEGSAHVALAAQSVGARLVHLSSDAVLPGGAGVYDETAVPSPVYPYGAAKAAAETAVRAIVPAAVVVRTSLILGDGQGGHERLTHDLAAGRRPGALFTDEIRMPVQVQDLADAVLELASGDHRGIINVAGADAVSRHELGVLVARRDGLDPDQLPTATLAGSGLCRPAELRLSIALARTLLRTRLRGAREFLAEPPTADPPPHRVGRPSITPAGRRLGP